MEVQGTVRDILQRKGDQVWTTTEDATVYEAIGLMGNKNIGALVVLDAQGKVSGVLSERDYSRKIVLQGRTSRETRVGDILSRPVITVQRKDAIQDCLKLMTEKRIRHLPVVVEDRLVGLISMGDLVSWVIESQQSTIEHLQGYISGEYPG
ncbi:MAG TPA: CBS domain-containing protein [Luteolibacter sp.]|nr:CBS domain-containing protein [Luteolibacter sp.]